MSFATLRPMAYFLVALLSLSSLSGCVANHVSTKVNSFAGSIPECNRFYVIPGQEHIDFGNLEFREYQEQLIKTLNGLGYQRQDADPCLVVFLSYGITQPSHVSSTYSLPQYGMTASGRYGVIGGQVHSSVDTYYTRQIKLDAMDVTDFSKTNKMVPVWRVIVTSTGSEGTVREVFPFMLKAAQEYIGKSGTYDVNVSTKDMTTKDVTGRQVSFGR